MHQIPCQLGRRACLTNASRELPGARGDMIAQLLEAPRLVQLQMLEGAEHVGTRLWDIGERAWLEILRDAGRRFVDDQLPLGGQPIDLSEHARLVSEATGVPTLRAVKASLALADLLSTMEDVLDAQAPVASRDGGEGWVLAPAGRHVAVRIPGSYPTFNAAWLVALALRRPTLLCAAGDPFTPVRLIEALHAAGLPDGAVSLCFDEADALFERADQVVCPGDELPQPEGPPGRVKRYHRGSSKAVLLGAGDDRLWPRLAAMAVQGSGRLCTSLSALLVDGDALEPAAALAAALARWPVAPLDDAEAIVPAFPDRALARRIDAAIAAAEARGAIDLSARSGAGQRVVELDGACFLRPTVLLVDRGDPLFGAEFPFPFVTVASVPRAEAPAACCGSLIVSLIGHDRALLLRLILEPTIDKVFHGEHIDRGHRSSDPHEGFLADFLFHKKAVWPPIERARLS